MALRRVLPAPPKRLQVDVSLFIVNIVLLLILFFISTGQLVNSPNFGVDLAETEELPVDSLPKPLLILNGDGSMSLNGEPIADAALAGALVGETRLHILVEKTAPAITLVALMARPEMALLEVRLVTLHTVGEPGGGQ